MPIISNVNARSWQGKTLYVIIYTLLIAGAVTMIYPFLLMLSGSLRTEADATEIRVVPGFWKDETILYRKYLEMKYGAPAILQRAWGQRPPSYERMELPKKPNPPHLQDYLEWRSQATRWELGQVQSGRLLGKNARIYRNKLSDRYDGNLEGYQKEFKIPVRDWSQDTPPAPPISRNPYEQDAHAKYWYDFAKTRPVEDRILIDTDALFISDYLIPTYTPDIKKYNEAHGTTYQSYDEITLSTRIPPENELTREEWADYVRNEIRLEFVKLDESLADNYRTFIGSGRYASVEEYNNRFGSNYSSFDEIPFPSRVPENPIALSDWENFLKDTQACTAEKISIHGNRHLYEAFLSKKRNLPLEELGTIRLPTEAADYHDLVNHSREWRREFTTMNYAHVFDFVGRHGNGIKNTVIYCLLAIGTALLVNPLAAYALSRYKPPSMYKILLFCMATMAFPGEVTMIPGFLLLKRFPAVPIFTGLVIFLLACWILNRMAGHWKESLRMILALALGIIVGAWLVPSLTGHTHISLLNTFWALVLPGAANGFFIFLLKGFFDSLPRELYEQAEIDGAGEWTKFWSITMNLSQPILAVIALGAFVSAYSAFMMALIIIPDQDMWTLMVWVFQLQSIGHQGVVYASLVITAIPTFLVFAFCQNIIIRGIVVPVEK